MRDSFLKWEWVGDESEPQATSACGGCFCFYMKDFRITACASWCNWFHHFFFLLFLLGQRHGQVVVECERCNLIFETSSVLDVSWIWTSLPNRISVGALTKALFFHIARFNRVLELLQSALLTSTGIAAPPATKAAPFVTMAWAALLQPPSPRCL